MLWNGSMTKLPVRSASGGFQTFTFTPANAGTLDRDWIASHPSVRF
jgi:hypothetical protein